jgi:hypothetical protein
VSENELEAEREEHDADNILTKEIDSWNNFEYALTEQQQYMLPQQQLSRRNMVITSYSRYYKM